MTKEVYAEAQTLQAEIGTKERALGRLDEMEKRISELRPSTPVEIGMVPLNEGESQWIEIESSEALALLSFGRTYLSHRIAAMREKFEQL